MACFGLWTPEVKTDQFGSYSVPSGFRRSSVFCSGGTAR